MPCRRHNNTLPCKECESSRWKKWYDKNKEQEQKRQQTIRTSRKRDIARNVESPIVHSAASVPELSSIDFVDVTCINVNLPGRPLKRYNYDSDCSDEDATEASKTYNIDKYTYYVTMRDGAKKRVLNREKLIDLLRNPLNETVWNTWKAKDPLTRSWNEHDVRL